MPRRRLRLLFRDGRAALLIGLVFLFSCTLLRQLAFFPWQQRPIGDLWRRHAHYWLGGHVAPLGNLPLRLVADSTALSCPREIVHDGGHRSGGVIVSLLGDGHERDFLTRTASALRSFAKARG